jgi:uncharacterized protein (DUF983 family)
MRRLMLYPPPWLDAKVVKPMKAEDTCICPTCGREFSAALKVCPVCMV